MALHQTKNPNIKGYIDEQKQINGTTHVYGWAFYKPEFSVLPIRVLNNHIEILLDCQPREDVSKFYKILEIVNCGWSFTVENTLFCELQMCINEKWETFFTFNETIVPQINVNIPSFIVVDNFYENPDAVREFALNCEFKEHPNNHKGRRTDETYRFPGLKERFEQLVGKKITSWEKYGTNCCFQYCIAGDLLVYHHDLQEYAGVLYLTPDAPPQTGTNLYRSKHTKKMKVPHEEHSIVFKNGFYDSTEFDLIDVVGNVYNRLILFDAQTIHAAAAYFGNTKENGRLFQLFFFDLEK
jgi:hypothetical protein